MAKAPAKTTRKYKSTKKKAVVEEQAADEQANSTVNAPEQQKSVPPQLRLRKKLRRPNKPKKNPPMLNMSGLKRGACI